jgi:glycosyltransferase involved in cell wall biosynthesis
MPVYERKDFFVEALESALNQTVKCKVIVVDNCSSHDYFEKICKSKNVPYYRNDRNIGMAANFARGFELSETKFVMNLQDDDQLSPIYVESFLEAFNKHPDIDIFFPDFVRLTARGKLPHRHVLPFGYMKNGEKVIEYGIKYKLGFPYMASAIKRAKVKSFEGEYEGSGSYDWVWIYSEADRFSFYGDPRILYIFRDHDMQDTKRNSIHYNLTIPYIYDVILKGKVKDTDLKRKAAKTAFLELVHLKSVADKKTIGDFLKKDTVFSNYLREKIKEDMLSRILFSLPTLGVYFCYKSMKKCGAIQ